MGMLERWRGFSLFQRVLLAILAAMIVGFGIAIPTVAGRKGIEYRDALLRFTQEGEVRRYTGRVDWKRTEFTVRPGGTVEYRWGMSSMAPTRWWRTPQPPLSAGWPAWTSTRGGRRSSGAGFPAGHGLCCTMRRAGFSSS